MSTTNTSTRKISGQGIFSFLPIVLNVILGLSGLVTFGSFRRSIEETPRLITNKPI